MSVLADFHFLRPWWLLALALLPIAGLAWRRMRSEAGNWKTMVDAHLLPHLLEATHERAPSGGLWLAACVWVIACTALAGPAWEREPMPLFRNDAARVLAIELAPTMLAADLKPSRLERARYKLNDILDESRDMQTALIGYSGDAFVAAPLTDDVNTVRNLIEALDPGVMPVVGNATERAISQAQKLVAQAGLSQGELILLADSASDAAIAAARTAHTDGLVVSVLGVGSNSGAPVPLPQGGFLQDAQGNIVLPRLDEAGLRALAKAGGGRYATLTTDRSDLASLLALDQHRADSRAGDGERALSERFLDRGPWLLLLLLPLAAFGFRRGWLMVFALVLLMPSQPVQAFEFADLWQRPDQQAAKALAEGDARRAQQLARDPDLRGSAAYRAEDYSAASEAWAKSSGADAMYNQGNALAKDGKYEEALVAYEHALELDPTNDDARANKQAVAEWLKRRQESPQDKNQQGDDQQKPDKSDQQKSQKQDADQGDESSDSPQDSQQDQADGKDQPGDEQGKDKQDKSDKGKGDAQGDDRKEAGDDREPPADAPEDAAEAAARQQQRAEQQKQLSQQIDQALEGQPEGDKSAMPVASPEEEAAREQDQALQQWLQRVPDDPGGLLRRKFQLEYERRQRGGGDGR